MQTRTARSTLVATALALSLTAGCRSKQTPAPPADKSVFGEIAARDDVDFAPYLAMARAIVTKTDRPKELPPPRPRQRAFVTVWVPGRDPIVASALGADLMSSVVAAAEAAAADAVPSPDTRVQIDVVASSETSPSLAGELRAPVHEVGTRGYVTVKGDRVGVVLPGEIVAGKYFDPDSMDDDKLRLARDRIASTLAARVGVAPLALDEMPIYAVTTTSRVDSSPPGRPVPLFRGMPPRKASLGPDELVEATRAGAQYLARAIDSKGHYTYLVHGDDTVDSAYSVLRHAGSTYALLEAYGELGDPALLVKAEAALGYLELALRGTPYGAYAGDNANEEQQKSGGAGLSLVAFAKHRELTGKKTYLAAMKALSKFLLHAQYPDGHFRANADVVKEDPSAKDKNLKPEVMYYAGEATLGLLRLHALEPDPVLLDAAKKSADYLINVRDAGKDEDHLLHDAWLSYALLDLWRATKNQAYADHLFAIARAIVKAEVKPEKARAPDFAGTFSALGETTPSATRLEALTAALELARATSQDAAWLEGPVMRIACFIRAQQYDADSAYFLKRPARMRGGVRLGLLGNDVRIDFVQHAISGWLRLAHVLRGPAPDAGK
jgi:hypothetical protein